MAEKPVVEETVIHRIRITLTSRNVPSLEKGQFTLFDLVLPRVPKTTVCMDYRSENLIVFFFPLSSFFLSASSASRETKSNHGPLFFISELGVILG